MTYCIPNLGRRRGFLAGAVGGLVGGLGFLLVTWAVGDRVGRFVGGASVGACVGACVGLVEVMFRRAWLDVVYAPGEVRTITLGPKPVSIGSDRRCNVYVRGVAQVAFRYRLTGGMIRCEDTVTGREEGVVRATDGWQVRWLLPAGAAADKQAVSDPPLL